MKKIFQKFILGVLFFPLSALTVKAKGEVEVLHWWTSGGEAAGLAVIKDNVEKKGVTWKDMPIAGGAGTNAMTVLRSRVAAGQPPTAVQLLGFDITDWAKEGVLGDLNVIAKAGNWDTVVPQALQKFAKYEGKWISVPVNVHSTNWVWANKAIFDKLKIGPLKSWADFEKAVNKLKAAGITPIAHGGQPWQDTTVFEAIVLGLDNGVTYKKAFIDLDPAAQTSKEMVKAFERLRFVAQNLDPSFSGRDWNLATSMIINGTAGMQMMGDWAKGEFGKANKVANKDFLCFRFPGTQGLVTFNADQFAMFKVDAEKAEAQKILAEVVMDKAVQAQFNQLKGSVPARMDIGNEGFDACGVKGMKDLKEASQKNTLFGSVAHGYAVPANLKNAIFDAVTAYFNDSAKTAAQGADDLALAIKNAK